MGGVSWDTFVRECDQVQTILIMDEIQVLYKPEGVSTCLFGGDRFWDTVKRVLQGGGLHIVTFASYEYRGAYSGPGYLKIISPFDLDEINTLWHQLTPYIQIMSPRTDLCDTCQHFRNGLQYNARKEEEAKDLLIQRTPSLCG